MNNHYRHVCKENYCPVVQQNVKYNLEKLNELENVCDRYESCKAFLKQKTKRACKTQALFLSG